MPKFDIRPDQQTEGEGLKKAAFESFGVKTLGLGDIAAPASSTDALSAMFDLEGFTTFSKQIEPHLSVPLYLSEFLNWLLDQIRQNVVREDKGDSVLLWAPLPFFVKFMGDGLLVLWNSGDMNDSARRNILRHCCRVCGDYVKEFLPTIADKIVDPPNKLRCGIARGTVLSVGDGQDYVGSCINMAARLQKLPGISFCFNRRGFELENVERKFFKQDLVVKQVAIRGIGDRELIGLLKAEVAKLQPRDRKLYKDV